MPNDFQSWWEDNWIKLNGRSVKSKALFVWNAAQVGKTKAMQDVLAERQRQIEVKGRTPELDDKYQGHELPCAAVCYALPHAPGMKRFWPWGDPYYPVSKSPEMNRTNLVKATALLLAEIERLDRIK